MRCVSLALFLLLTLALLPSLVDCAGAPPPPRLQLAASCRSGLALPRCSDSAGVRSVREMVAAGLAPNTVAQVEGRLVPGARCCLDRCPPICSVQLALVDESERALTPASGPLLLLTVADKFGLGFRTQTNATLPVTCPLRSNVTPDHPGTYCCDAEVSGQLVRATGRVVEQPIITSQEPQCMTAGVDDMPPMAPACQISAPWRNDWRQVRALAVEQWCAVDPE